MDDADAILEPTAGDLDQVARTLGELWRFGGADARMRFERMETWLRKHADARRRQRFVFMRDIPSGWWLIGPADHPMAHKDDQGRRGLAIAHYVLEQGRRVVPYAELEHLGGAVTQKACHNALHTAAKWVRDVAQCAPVADAIDAIETAAAGMTYRRDGSAEIITRIRG